MSEQQLDVDHDHAPVDQVQCSGNWLRDMFPFSPLATRHWRRLQELIVTANGRQITIRNAHSVTSKRTFRTVHTLIVL